jgi:hypothetical protein
VTTAIGLFDPELALYAQDLDYCLRARAAGWRVVQLPGVEVVHVGGATIAAGNPIATGSVSTLRQDPVALFADLDRWIHKAFDAHRARERHRALVAGCRLRIVARRALRWRRGSASRAAWDCDTERYRAALAALRSIASR